MGSGSFFEFPHHFAVECLNSLQFGVGQPRPSLAPVEDHFIRLEQAALAVVSGAATCFPVHQDFNPYFLLIGIVSAFRDDAERVDFAFRAGGIRREPGTAQHGIAPFHFDPADKHPPAVRLHLFIALPVHDPGESVVLGAGRIFQNIRKICPVKLFRFFFAADKPRNGGDGGPNLRRDDAAAVQDQPVLQLVTQSAEDPERRPAAEIPGKDRPFFVRARQEMRIDFFPSRLTTEKS